MSRAMNPASLVLGVSMGVALLVCPQHAHTADATLSLDFVSAYVFRGNTFNNGPVLQPGLSVGNFKLNEKTAIPLTLGVWGNMDLGDYNGTLQEGDFSEIDFTASYALPEVIDKLGWSVGYTEYVYPGGADSDREINIGFTLNAFLSPSLTISYGLDGAVQDNWYLEGGVKHTFDLDPVKLSLGTTLAYQMINGTDTPQFTVTSGASPQEAAQEIVAQYRTWFMTDDGAAAGLGPLVLTASATYKFLTASVSYVAGVNKDILSNPDVKVVGKIGVTRTF